MRKIGIMGGTFNPIHNGHLALAQHVLDDLCMDEIWFVPTGVSYMKANVQMVSAQERYHMTELAVAANEKMKCLDLELKRTGYTYTYETLEQLRQEYPDDSFYFIFGADCLFEMEHWRAPERIFSACTIVAATRNGTSIEVMKEKMEELTREYHADIILYPFLNLEISSTELRETVRQGKSIRYLVPDSVASYIQEKRFYRKDESLS